MRAVSYITLPDRAEARNIGSPAGAQDGLEMFHVRYGDHSRNPLREVRQAALKGQTRGKSETGYAARALRCARHEGRGEHAPGRSFHELLARPCPGGHRS